MKSTYLCLNLFSVLGDNLCQYFTRHIRKKKVREREGERQAVVIAGA